MLRRILLSTTTAMLLLSPLQFQAHAQSVEYQRQDCINRGGTYRFPNCIESRSNTKTENGYPYGHIYSLNQGGCTYKLLLAWVSPGEDKYTVDGWWETPPLHGLHLQSDNKFMIHDPNYQLYYFALKSNGESVRNLSKDRTFIFEGQSYDMTALTTGIYEGKYWIQILC